MLIEFSNPLLNFQSCFWFLHPRAALDRARHSNWDWITPMQNKVETLLCSDLKTTPELLCPKTVLEVFLQPYHIAAYHTNSVWNEIIITRTFTQIVLLVRYFSIWLTFSRSEVSNFFGSPEREAGTVTCACTNGPCMSTCTHANWLHVSTCVRANRAAGAWVLQMGRR